MQKLPCVDLFSGIGGISLALDDFVQTTLYCEINPFCQQILANRMASGHLQKAPIHSDICNLHLPQHNNLPQPVMLFGGFPCTDISSIGLQKGITNDTQSGLFLEIMRLVDDNPSIQILFLENVSNISKCGMKEVVDELSKRNFTFCWKMKSASSFGAPHHRMRWFCLAVKHSCTPSIKESLFSCTQTDNHKILNCHSNWLSEPDKRITFKPDFKADPDFDSNWSLRCQTLGNSVVPVVVRHAFLELVRLHQNLHNIMSCFEDFSTDLSNLTYPFPDAGIVYDSKCYLLPDSKSINTSKTTTDFKITLEHHGKTLTFEKYPTPRRGITHASSLTDRSIRDLPTILVYCNQTQDFLHQNSLKIDTTQLHTMLLPNVQYIEWMMGYPKDWTKIPFPFNFKSTKPKTDPAMSNNNEPDENLDANEKTEKAHRSQVHKTSASTSVTQPKYNGMHMFMKEHPGKSVRIIAQMWKALPDHVRKEYTLKAKQLH